MIDEFGRDLPVSIEVDGIISRRVTRTGGYDHYPRALIQAYDCDIEVTNGRAHMLCSNKIDERMWLEYGLVKFLDDKEETVHSESHAHETTL